ncbi:hypothetical protein BGX28_005185 [Mortierella sp. GBA30]|nr:hypothetical protein BGX28_005185 [Mortierella sp. GBA30]
MPLPVENRNINNPLITIPGLGTVKGLVDDRYPVAKFLNVPFGTVQERWRPAVKAKPWDGIRDATKNGPISPQSTNLVNFSSVISGLPEEMAYEEWMNERDCLNCNIYMPSSALNSEEELPVLVWIYGGGFRNGGIASPLYDCTELVATAIELKKPMVVVAINYRVNYLGFMSSKELTLDAQEYASTIPETQHQWYDGSVGNWGHLDQILGLEWVRDHIRAFSGNPKSVTAMGESAGAISIAYLQMVPQAHGLFYRSILQSGGPATLPPKRAIYQGQQYFDHLCKVFDISADLLPLERVAKLRAIPEKDIAEAVNDMSVAFLFGPTLDDVVFKRDSRLSSDDTSNYSPSLNWVMAGTCGDEVNLDNFAKFKNRVCAPADSEVFDRIFGVPKTDPEVYAIVSRMFNHGFFKYPTLQVCNAIKAHPSCRLSRFSFDAKAVKMDTILPNIGAHHGVDMFFTFGNKFSQTILSDEEMAFAKKVQSVWIEVATAKSPESSWIPTVRSVDRSLTADDDAKEKATIFGVHLELETGPAERVSDEENAFWKRSFLYMAEQAEVGKGAEVGFDMFKAL